MISNIIWFVLGVVVFVWMAISLHSDGRPWWRAILPVAACFCIAIPLAGAAIDACADAAHVPHRYHWIVVLTRWAVSIGLLRIMVMNPMERATKRLNPRDITRFGELVATDEHGFHPDAYDAITQRLTHDFVGSQDERGDLIMAWVANVKRCQDRAWACQLWDWYTGHLDLPATEARPEPTSPLGDTRESAL